MAKKNIRKIPKSVEVQLDKIKSRYIVAACLCVLPSEKILKGELKHLGIKLNDTELSIPEDSVLPDESIGKYSERNVNGYEVVRRDLPKETHYNPVETPNWGDSTYGTHTVELPYEKYPRDFYSPQNMRIKIEAQDKNPDKNRYVFTFEVDKVLDREAENFKDDLLECLNILQENIGTCGVQKSGVSLSDYLETMNVSWEVLPPGTREEALERIFANRKPSAEDKNTAGERYDFFMKLQPKKLIYGATGLQRYFGALLEKDLVVFKNIQYGNAIYIMFKEWEELSKRTRTELLSGRYGENFERILHISGWKGRVRILVASHREKIQ